MNLIILFFMMSGSGGEGGSTFGVLLPFILIFAIMYLLIFRPQAKKRKQQEAMIQSLKKGDKVLTTGGVYGTIAGIKEKEQTLILKIADNVKIEISRSAIATIRE